MGWSKQLDALSPLALNSTEAEDDEDVNHDPNDLDDDVDDKTIWR